MGEFFQALGRIYTTPAPECQTQKMYLVKSDPLNILIVVEVTIFFLSMLIAKAIELNVQRTPS